MRAIVLNENDGNIEASHSEVAESSLPEGNVTVAVEWSGLNYKDALAITGKGKIIRQYPMVPGIDFAGRVLASQDPRFQRDQQVLLTGWGVGESHWGGLAEQARVNADWLMPLPEGLTGRQAMIIGTAGLTAMLCVMALEQGGVNPHNGRILVTGAGGGVGSTAVALLHQLGYQVSALSGRSSTHAMLNALGANEIIDRQTLATPGRPLEKQRWAGAIDCVGGEILANVLSQIQYNGVVAACGLAGGMTLPTTVMPFILRGVRLQGIDSVMQPHSRRLEAWERLVHDLPETFYAEASHEIALQQVPQAAADLLNNTFTGRMLVRIS